MTPFSGPPGPPPQGRVPLTPFGWMSARPSPTGLKNKFVPRGVCLQGLSVFFPTGCKQEKDKIKPHCAGSKPRTGPNQRNKTQAFFWISFHYALTFTHGPFPACAAGAIGGMILTALNAKWHETCFRCIRCIQGSDFLKPSKPEFPERGPLPVIYPFIFS